MVTRKCPVCGVHWSSAAEVDWICPKCNVNIPAEDVETDKEKAALKAAEVNSCKHTITAGLAGQEGV